MKVRINFFGNALHTGPGKRIERPSFGAVLPCSSGFPRQNFTPPAVEACEMTAAGQSGPNEAVLIDVDSTREETLFGGLRIVERRFVRFRHTGPPFHAHNLAWCSWDGTPYHSVVGRIGNDAVNAVHRYRFVDLRINFAIAVHIVIAPAPSLGSLLAAGFLQHI